MKSWSPKGSSLINWANRCAKCLLINHNVSVSVCLSVVLEKCLMRLNSLLLQFCTKTGRMSQHFTVKSFALFRMAASRRHWMSWTPTQRCSAGKRMFYNLSFVTCVFCASTNSSLKCWLISLFSDVVFEKAYCEYRLNRVESSLKTIESAPEQTDKLKELYGQVVRLRFTVQSMTNWKAASITLFFFWCSDCVTKTFALVDSEF